jgi:hypothetical protein
MAIQVEMWQPQIKEELFAVNTFLNHLRDADEYVVGGRTVHIPQSGGPSDVEKNRAVLPAQISKRVDTDITYVLDEYTTDPVLIPNADKVELSYDKMRSVIQENTGKLMEYIGDDLLFKLIENVPAGKKIPTTGGNAAATAPGGTGNRKIIDEADIRTAAVQLDKDNVPTNNRYLLLPADMYNQLMSDDSLKYAFQNPVSLRSGDIPELFGFKLLKRSSVARVDNSLAPKDPTAANATTDAEAAIFWQMNSLERALGDVTMFDNYGRAEYYGDIFSFLIRMGGRACRADNKGYGIIYRATP